MVNNHAILLVLFSEVYLELNQTSTMELFVKIGNVDIRWGSKYTSNSSMHIIFKKQRRMENFVNQVG